MLDEKDIRMIENALLAIDRLIGFSNEHNYDEAEQDFRISDVLLLEFENLANACMRISSEAQKQLPDNVVIQLRAIRNRIAHDYLSVSLEILYATIKNDLPNLEKLFKELINKNSI